MVFIFYFLAARFLVANTNVSICFMCVTCLGWLPTLSLLHFSCIHMVHCPQSIDCSHWSSSKVIVEQDWDLSHRLKYVSVTAGVSVATFWESFCVYHYLATICCDASEIIDRLVLVMRRAVSSQLVWNFFALRPLWILRSVLMLPASPLMTSFGVLLIVHDCYVMRRVVVHAPLLPGYFSNVSLAFLCNHCLSQPWQLLAMFFMCFPSIEGRVLKIVPCSCVMIRASVRRFLSAARAPL